MERSTRLVWGSVNGGNDIVITASSYQSIVIRRSGRLSRNLSRSLVFCEPFLSRTDPCYLTATHWVTAEPRVCLRRNDVYGMASPLRHTGRMSQQLSGKPRRACRQRGIGGGHRIDHIRPHVGSYGSRVVPRLRKIIMHCHRKAHVWHRIPHIHFSEQMLLPSRESSKITRQSFELAAHPLFFYLYHFRRVSCRRWHWNTRGRACGHGKINQR